MIKKLINFFKDQLGASMPEYGLLVSLIAIAAIGGITLTGTTLEALFQAVAAAL